jgi:transposase
LTDGRWILGTRYFAAGADVPCRLEKRVGADGKSRKQPATKKLAQTSGGGGGAFKQAVSTGFVLIFLLRLPSMEPANVWRPTDKVRDIVGLYLSPPNRALVLSVDEKSQIQALDREQPVLPMMPGVPERRTHSYVRHGTTSLFAALDVASGFVIGKCYKRHRAAEFLNFLKEIDAQVPERLDIHIVMDNYATHKTHRIKAWLARRPHYHIHFTPTSASWINQVERWFAELTRKRLQRGVHTSVRELEADIRAFIDRHNQNPRPFKWTKSADQILASVKRFCHKAQQTLCGEL